MVYLDVPFEKRECGSARMRMRRTNFLSNGHSCAQWPQMGKRFNVLFPATRLSWSPTRCGSFIL